MEAPHLHRQQKESVSLLEAAKRSLPVAFREDGPPLGFDFDDVPGLRPGARQHITGQCYPSNPPNLRDIRGLAHTPVSKVTFADCTATARAMGLHHP